MYKLKEKDFVLFKKICKKWIKKLGLSFNEFYFDFKSTGQSLARTYYDYEGRILTIRLDPEWDEKPTIKTLTNVAIHEVFEALLLPLQSVAYARNSSLSTINAERHIIVNTLLNLVGEQI